MQSLACCINNRAHKLSVHELYEIKVMPLIYKKKLPALVEHSTADRLQSSCDCPAAEAERPEGALLRRHDCLLGAEHLPRLPEKVPHLPGHSVAAHEGPPGRAQRGTVFE